MRSPLPARVRRVVREARRWGLPGALAVALLLAGVGLWLATVPSGRAALADDEHALQAARRRLAAARAERAAEAGARVVDPGAAFLAAFPPEAQRHRRVTNLLSLAAGMGLQPVRSDLRVAPEPSLGLARVRLVLPLAGSYVQLRRFIDQALRDDPALSLDQLRLERRDADAADLRAELQWSFWMRGANAAPGRP